MTACHTPSQELQDWTADSAPSTLPPAPAAAAATAAAVVTTAAVKAAPVPVPVPVPDVAAVDRVPVDAQLDGAVDTSTLVDDHPWLVESGEKVATALNEDAHAVAKVEQQLVAQPLNEEAAKLAAEEQQLVQNAQSALVKEEKSVIAEAEVVEAKVEGMVVEAEEVISPLEKEVTTVVQKVEQEASLVETEVSGVAEWRGGDEGGERCGRRIDCDRRHDGESWTFFGVFLFSLYRVSRKERKWWRGNNAHGHGVALT